MSLNIIVVSVECNSETLNTKFDLPMKRLEWTHDWDFTVPINWLLLIINLYATINAIIIQTKVSFVKSIPASVQADPN